MTVAPLLLTRRRLLLPVLVAAHVGLVAAATAGRPVAVVPPPQAMATFAVATPLPLPVAPAQVQVAVASNVESPVVDIAADAAAVPGGPCALTASIEAVLRASPEARAALAALPSSARSVADAVTVWNSGWTTVATPALDAVRRAVTGEIRAAPASCRAAPVDGPRLVYVDNDTGATVLVFGSGRWAWSDLLA